MEQFIAPKMLIVDVPLRYVKGMKDEMSPARGIPSSRIQKVGERQRQQPAPCLCRTEGSTKVICEFCVQANLILWEREEGKIGRRGRGGMLLKTFEKLDKPRLAAMLGVNVRTIYKWLDLKEIPERYARKWYRKFPQGIPGVGVGENGAQIRL